MEPEHTLYVGDSYDNDIVGARNGGGILFGLTTALVNYQVANRITPCRSHLFHRTLSDCGEII